MAIRQIATWLTLLVITSYVMDIKGMDDCSVKEIIRTKIALCIKAFSDDDFETYFTIFDEDAEIVNDLNEVAHGREGVYAIYNKVKKVGKNLNIDHIHINVMKGIAIVTDNYELFPGNGEQTGEGRRVFCTAGDGEGLSGQNQKKFTTYDNDNDELSSGNCATEWGGEGGFWYGRCDYVNPNGAYLTPGVSNDQGIEWEAWLVDKSLKATEMKFRPMNYP